MSNPDHVAAALRTLADQIAPTDPSRAQIYRDKADLHERAAKATS